MKLSLVFELLLIFVLLAFAASKSVRTKKNSNKKGIQNRNDGDKLEDNSINKYCKCSEAHCRCCRDFQVPVVNLNGPGCATLTYLNGDKMSVSLNFGKKVITNRTLSSRKPTPVCLPIPGGISKFCGRVYNIARSGEEFRACLGLELQSKSTVEAAVRVSCFKFGPRGVTSEPADPLPLVPQGEKVGGDDDDDDDEDEFGLGDDDDDDEDDDDDDDEGELDAINDVDSADYTGFSLLGEDLLGDLFGSSGNKKPNKNKKKQAPAPTPTTTTTTRRPRPSRRPSRRPSTRTTTPRSVPTRTTTVRIRPASRRPTRKPSRRRPSKKPTTAIIAESPTTTSVTTPASTVSIPIVTPAPVIPIVSSTERRQVIEIETDQTFEPIIGVNEKVQPLSITTPKTVTNFEDAGLKMSLAHITGQLSAMPVTPIIPSTAKESKIPSTSSEELNYEKIETITPKMPSTVSFVTSTEEKVNDDMVQIVHDLDSHSEESNNKESITAEESRGHSVEELPVSSDFYEGLKLPKKKHRSNFNFEDLDVLHLSEIGQTVGDHLGLFGRSKRQHKNKDNKVKDGKNEDDDYSDILGLDELLRKSNNENKNKNKKDRRRQNKMMRGEWSQV